METKTNILCIIGTTASGKSTRAVEEALQRNGEVISVDSRQVYRRLDIGTEKISKEEMRGVKHHLVDIREPKDSYSAGNFVSDASLLIQEITERKKLPILAGGTHFYFDALLQGLPVDTETDTALRKELEKYSNNELYELVTQKDPRRAKELDPRNRRRLIRALEVINKKGFVPERVPTTERYAIEWLVMNPSAEDLRERIDLRLKNAFQRGLISEVESIREEVGDVRLNEFGLEYKIIGEYLRNERIESSLFPTLSAKLWQYARRQKAWLRKLETLTQTTKTQSLQSAVQL